MPAELNNAIHVCMLPELVSQKNCLKQKSNIKKLYKKIECSLTIYVTLLGISGVNHETYKNFGKSNFSLFLKFVQILRSNGRDDDKLQTEPL